MKETKADQIVRVYGELLADLGPRHATLDAVARRCGLSRAGLLHHHRSRAALDAALLDRLAALVDADLEAMAAAPEGAARYYLVSSFDADSPLERTVVAASRLAQGGSAVAAEALRAARERWHRLIQDELGDRLLATFVLLAGDGVSHQTDIAAALPDGDAEFVTATDIAELADAVRRVSSAASPPSRAPSR